MKAFFNKLVAKNTVKPGTAPPPIDETALQDDENNKLYNYSLLLDFNKKRQQYIERITEQPPAEIDIMITEYCQQRELSISDNDFLLCRIIDEKLDQLRTAKKMIVKKGLTAEGLIY